MYKGDPQYKDREDEMTYGRASEIKPFIVMDVMERAEEMERQGERIIHLEVGEPDFETPEPIKEACYRAIKDGKTHYTHSLGLKELREAISDHYKIKYGVFVNPDQVIITSGTSPGMFLLFSVLVEKGDEIILPDPHYACYPNFIRFLNGVPVFVDVYEEDGFQYRPEKIKERITPRTKAIIINSPANPTGTLLSAERMKIIADMGHYIISDEIYHGLVYEGKEHTALEFTDRALILNGFSKLYAMTGWRLGYIIVPKEFVRPIQKIHQNFFISCNSFVQWSGIAALKETGPYLESMIRTYDERRKLIIKRLKEIGFGIKVDPTGAFYVLANAKRFSNDSFRLAFDILEKAKVGVTPGIDFGNNGEGYLRFSYANSIENIEEGMDRIGKYLHENYNIL
jgi:aspartate/methionine/tyrosine aminotransferase